MQKAHYQALYYWLITLAVLAFIFQEHIPYGSLAPVLLVMPALYIGQKHDLSFKSGIKNKDFVRSIGITVTLVAAFVAWSPWTENWFPEYIDWATIMGGMLLVALTLDSDRRHSGSL